MVKGQWAPPASNSTPPPLAGQPPSPQQADGSKRVEVGRTTSAGEAYRIAKQRHSKTRHPLPFPREVVPAEPRDCPCTTAPCRVHTEEGNRPSPLAGGIQADSPQARGGGPLPNGGLSQSAGGGGGWRCFFLRWDLVLYKVAARDPCATTRQPRWRIVSDDGGRRTGGRSPGRSLPPVWSLFELLSGWDKQTSSIKTKASSAPPPPPGVWALGGATFDRRRQSTPKEGSPARQSKPPPPRRSGTRTPGLPGWWGG